MRLRIKISLAVVLTLFSQTIFAEGPKGANEKQVRSWGLVAAVQSEYRSEKANNGTDFFRTIPGYMLGVRYQNQFLQFESNSFKVNSVSGNLSVSRRTESQWLSYWYELDHDTFLIPSLGGGAGLSRDFITTSLAGASQDDQSAGNQAAYIAARVRFDIPCVWLATDLRVETISNLHPNPTVAVGIQLGLFF